MSQRASRHKAELPPALPYDRLRPSQPGLTSTHLYQVALLRTRTALRAFSVAVRRTSNLVYLPPQSSPFHLGCPPKTSCLLCVHCTYPHHAARGLPWPSSTLYLRLCLPHPRAPPTARSLAHKIITKFTYVRSLLCRAISHLSHCIRT